MMVAWDRQKWLKMNSKVPTQKDLIRMFGRVESERDRALFVTAYLTGARCSEYAELKPSNIQEDTVKGVDILIFNLVNRKNRRVHTKQALIPIEKEEELVRMALPYAYKVGETSKIWPITTRRIRQLFDKYFKWNTHYLRKVRLTHLTTMYGFDALDRVRWAGWKDSRPDVCYDLQNYADIVRRFK